MKDVFTVEWTGSYPSLCSGCWEITYKGEPVDLPEDVYNSEMNTYGSYQTWHFENWLEVFEDYEDGLNFDDWIKANSWVDSITTDPAERLELYLKIQEKDWRHNSCGGCI